MAGEFYLPAVGLGRLGKRSYFHHNSHPLMRNSPLLAMTYDSLSTVINASLTAYGCPKMSSFFFRFFAGRGISPKSIWNPSSLSGFKRLPARCGACPPVKKPFLRLALGIKFSVMFCPAEGENKVCKLATEGSFCSAALVARGDVFA